jgi:hypothetical protein
MVDVNIYIDTALAAVADPLDFHTDARAPGQRSHRRDNHAAAVDMP